MPEAPAPAAPAPVAPAGGATPAPKAAPAPAAAATPAAPAAAAAPTPPAKGDAAAPAAKPPSAQERLAAAKAKHPDGAASKATPAASPAATETAATPGAAAPTPAPATEGAAAPPAAKPDKPTADAWAQLADREAAHVEAARTFKTEKAAFEAERTTWQATRGKAEKAIELAAKGDHLGALEAMGVDMEKAQDQYLAGVRDKTPEELAAAAAKTELDRREAERKEADAKADKDKETARATEFQSQLKTWCGGVIDELNKAPSEFKTLREHQVWDAGTGEFRPMTDIDVYNRCCKLEMEAAKAEGRAVNFPTARKALEMVEADLRKRSQPAAPAPAAAAAPADKKNDTAEDNAPTTLTPEGAGSVPLRSKARPKGESAFDRLQKAKAARGVH